jgi:MinD-like ATPase involved in chromosome partitioning or flagellar assembly
MARAECIAFTNHKGGTGKTTSCLSVAGYLAKPVRPSEILAKVEALLASTSKISYEES